jgi:hypothetical protein
MGLLSWHVQTRGYCRWLEDELVRRLDIYESNFACVDVSELNPKGWDRFG